MRLSRLLSIFGILFIIYALVSGLKLEIVSDLENATFRSSYSFKVDSFILGGILILLGLKLRKSEN